MTLTLEELHHIAATEKKRQSSYQYQINICVAAGCLSCGSGELKTALENGVEQREQGGRVLVRGVGCLGLCSKGPLVAIQPGDILYQGCNVADVSAILDALGKEPV